MKRAMKPVWLQDVLECMKTMEVVLGEKCSDLDYTAVRVGIGRGDDESGIIGAGDCELGGGWSIKYK